MEKSRVVEREIISLLNDKERTLNKLSSKFSPYVNIVLKNSCRTTIAYIPATQKIRFYEYHLEIRNYLPCSEKFYISTTISYDLIDMIL